MSDNKIKVIFIDIDGVLSPFGEEKYSYKEGEFPYAVKFSQKCVDNLNKLLEKSGAKLVIHSDWGKQMKLVNIITIFATHGIKGPYALPKDVGKDDDIKNIFSDASKLYDIAITEKKFSSNKSHEIGFWLSDYEQFVESYVIIDDKEIYPDYDAFADRNSRTVKPDSQVGLTEKDVEKALSILNEKL